MGIPKGTKSSRELGPKVGYGTSDLLKKVMGKLVGLNPGGLGLLRFVPLTTNPFHKEMPGI